MVFAIEASREIPKIHPKENKIHPKKAQSSFKRCDESIRISPVEERLFSNQSFIAHSVRDKRQDEFILQQIPAGTTGTTGNGRNGRIHTVLMGWFVFDACIHVY